MKKTSPQFTEHRPANAPQKPAATPAAESAKNTAASKPAPSPKPVGECKPKEIGGPKGPEPTRYGDWERDGRCVDF